MTTMSQTSSTTRGRRRQSTTRASRLSPHVLDTTTRIDAV